MAVSMPHGKVYRPAKFRELTGMRRAPKYDPDNTLVSALEYAKHKTGLGYHMWGEFIRDFRFSDKRGEIQISDILSCF